MRRIRWIRTGRGLLWAAGGIALLLPGAGGHQSRAAAPPAATAAPAAPAAAPGPRAVIENVVRDVLVILRNPKLSADERREKVKQIAYDNLDFEVMARLSLGKYYRGLTDAQRSQYLEVFKQHVTNTYRHTTDQYTDEDVKITGDRREPDGDWTVLTVITGTKNNKPGSEVAKVDYRLRSKGGPWKVIDLTIDGVSLVQNLLAQFQDIMAKGGIDNLLQQLRDKNASNSK